VSTSAGGLPVTPLYRKLSASARAANDDDDDSDGGGGGGAPVYFGKEAIRNAVATSKVLAAHLASPSAPRHTPSSQPRTDAVRFASPSPSPHRERGRGARSASPAPRGLSRSASPPRRDDELPFPRDVVTFRDTPVTLTCRRHSQPLVLFCDVCEVPLCLSCCSCPPHENHTRVDIVDAARDGRCARVSVLVVTVSRCGSSVMAMVMVVVMVKVSYVAVALTSGLHDAVVQTVN
jgi:hypothetical protein